MLFCLYKISVLGFSSWFERGFVWLCLGVPLGFPCVGSLPEELSAFFEDRHFLWVALGGLGASSSIAWCIPASLD